MPVLGEKGLGMELHALHRETAVAHAHDFTVFGLGGDFQTGRQSRATNRERMIARRDEGARKPAEHAEAEMTDRRSLPVDNSAGMRDLAPEGLADRLMA